MDLFEESRDDRLIEEYLFSGYKPHQQKSTFDADQTFARPIEDEDLFCVRDDIGAAAASDATDDVVMPNETAEEALEPSSNQFEFDRPFRRLSDDEPLCETNARSPGRLFEDEASDPPSELATNQQQENMVPLQPIDEIFIDDFSESGDATNNENLRPQLEKSYSKAPPAPQLTPAQVKKKLMMERLKQQAIALQEKSPKPPPRFGAGLTQDSTIEFTVQEAATVPETSSRVLFNKLFNMSKKTNEVKKSPKSDKQDWISYSAMLRKRISAQKRKVWDSFQAPADNFDEEEELVEGDDTAGSEKAASEADDQDQADNDADAESDGNVEDDEDETKSSKSDDPFADEAEIDDSDLEDPDDDDDDGDVVSEDEKSAMECDQGSSDESEPESDDEIVRRKIIYDDDEDSEDNGGSVRKFIDDEVEVDEDP